MEAFKKKEPRKSFANYFTSERALLLGRSPKMAANEYE
jgi:hypothetical protein